MKKALALMLALVLGLGLFAACGKKGPAPVSSGQEQTQEPVTIKWMHHYAEEARIAWAQEVAEKTHELYPWITVEIEVQPYDNFIATLKTKIQSDDAPDLYNVQSRVLLEEFYQAGYCTDLSGADFTGNILDAGLDAGRIDDGIYSIVQDLGGAIVFYNKDMFAKNDLSVPYTYSEWLNVLNVLQDAGVAPMAAGFQEVWVLLIDLWADFVPALFWDNDDWAINKMNGSESFAGDTLFAEEMERMYHRSGYTQADPFGTDWNKACELVATEQAAMVLGGYFALDAILSKNPDINLGAFALPISENPAEARTGLGNPGGFIVHNGPNQAAAQKLLGVMLSEEMAGKYQVLARTISTVKGLDSDLEPALQEILDIEADGRTISTSSKEYTFSGEYQKAFVTELVVFLMGDGDIEAFARKLDDAFALVD